MKELTIYSATCTACRTRAEMAQIRQFAQKHKLTIVTKRANYSREYRQEAEDIGAPLPFVKVGSYIIPLQGVTAGALELALYNK